MMIDDDYASSSLVRGRKSRLYRSFVDRKHATLNFSTKALTNIVQSLRTSFLDHQSTSLMITGSNTEAFNLVLQAQHILLRESRSEWLMTGGRDRALIGRITGNLNDSDAVAIVSLADQFCLRPGRDRNINAMLEDLGVFFQQCKSDGTPALILIEDFHLFAHQKRQTLIYTLLDLLHRADYLFAVIGITERLDAFSGLEKRVASRMSSQNVVIPFPSVEEICAELHWLLTLRPRASWHQRKRDRPADSHATNATEKSGSTISAWADEPEDDVHHNRVDATDDQEDDLWRRDYNRSVVSLFGDFVLRPLVIPRHRFVADAQNTVDEEEIPTIAMDTSTTNNTSNSADNASTRNAVLDTNEPVPSVQTLFFYASEAVTVPSSSSPPLAKAMIQRDLNFGRSRRHFVKAALNLLTLLSADKPSLSIDIFAQALEMNEPPQLSQLLSSLSLSELSLYAVMARLQCAPGNALKVPRQLVLEDVLGDYDRLTGGFLSAPAPSSTSSTSAYPSNDPNNNNNKNNNNSTKSSMFKSSLACFADIHTSNSNTTYTYTSSSSSNNTGRSNAHNRQSLQHAIEGLRRLMSLNVVSLWSGMRGRPLPAALLQASLLPSVVATLEHTAEEITAAFSLPTNNTSSTTNNNSTNNTTSTTTNNSTSSKGGVRLVMPERVRAAVLRPLVPLVYVAPPSTINNNNSNNNNSNTTNGNSNHSSGNHTTHTVTTFAQANSHAPPLLLQQLAGTAAAAVAK